MVLSSSHASFGVYGLYPLLGAAKRGNAMTFFFASPPRLALNQNHDILSLYPTRTGRDDGPALRHTTDITELSSLLLLRSQNLESYDGWLHHSHASALLCPRLQ